MWPDKVWLLTDNCNISGDFGTHTEGWPDTVDEWVSFCLPKEYRKDWWTMYYRLSYWENDNYQLFNDLLGVTSRFEAWNRLVRIRYNLTYALLGYTEGQSEQVLKLLATMQASNFFQKYRNIVLYDHGTFYSLIERHAKEKDYTKRQPRKPLNLKNLVKSSNRR